MQVEDRSARVQHIAGACIKYCAAAGAQNNGLVMRDLINDLCFASAECGLALNLKNSCHADTGACFEFVVGIEEGPTEPLRQQLSDGGLARSHQTDQKDVLRVHSAESFESI